MQRRRPGKARGAHPARRATSRPLHTTALVAPPLPAAQLISKSLYFDENIPDAPAAPGPTEMLIRDFPGGPSAFETVAKYCYGIDIELSVDSIAPVYCAARVLRVPELEKSTEAFMAEVVLRDPAKAAVALKVATGIGAEAVCGSG